jgi:hypothetical protein
VKIHSFEKTVYIHVNDAAPVEGNVVITSLPGQVVHQCALQQNAQQIDLSGLATGVYFVNVTCGDKNFVKKIYIY